MKKYCLYFNKKLPSWVIAPNTSNLLNGKTEGTLECWVKFDRAPENGGDHDGVCGFRTTTGDADFYILKLGTNVWELRIATPDGHWDLNPSWFELNTWLHIVFIRDGSIAKAYFNGQEVASRSDISGIWGTSSDFHVGATPSVVFHTTGYIDEVRFYDRALTEEEVLASWNSGRGGPPNNMSGLKIWYPYNEGGGTIAHDVSGNEHHGNIYSAMWVSDYTLDLEDGYILTSDNPSIKPGTITIDLRFWPSDEGGDFDRILNKEDCYELAWNCSENKLHFRFVKEDLSDTGWQFCSDSLDPRRWYHVILFYEKDSVDVFLNGSKVYSNDFGTGQDLNTDSSYDLYIGKRYNGFDRFKGKLDEIKIYNRRLTETEIEHNFNFPYSPVQDGLVLWYKFGEGTGNLVSDSSPEDNSGNLNGNYSWYSLDSPPWLRFFKIRLVPK